MASKPFKDMRAGTWIMKYRPAPLGPWVRVVLGTDPRIRSARPPATPPQPVLDRHREFSEIEYRAKHGISAAPVRAKSLDEYTANYLEGFAVTAKQASQAQARRHVESFREFAKGQGVTTVQGVTRAVCRDYLSHLAANVSHDYLRTIVGYLSPLWSKAYQDGLILANPWSKIKIPGKSTRRVGTVWTSDQVGAIARNCCRTWQTDFVLFLANTGLRISTALVMTWDWVEWAKDDYGLIRVPADQAAKRAGVKTAYVHKLSPAAHELLARLKVTSHSDLLFPNPIGGKPVIYGTAQAAIDRAVILAKVPHGTPHDLRRTYATLLAQSGAPIDFVSRQLGHTSIVTTQKYIGPVEFEGERHLASFSIGIKQARG